MKFFKKALLITCLSIGSLLGQEVLDISFPVNGTLISCDSVKIPDGYIASGLWQDGLDSATTVGFKWSTDGSNFYTIAQQGKDTTAYVVPVSTTIDYIIPLEPTTMFITKGTYASETAKTWLKPYLGSKQVKTATIYIRFIPYVGKDQ